MHVGEFIKGGVYSYLYDILEYQSNIKDSSIYLVASNYKSEKKYPIKKENIFYYKYKRNPLYMMYAMIYILILIKKIKPDIIHVHSTFAGLFVRLPFIFLPKKDIKIVYCSHGWSFLMETSLLAKKIYIKIEKILSKVTTRIINISKYEQIESIKVGIPKSKSLLIYNGSKKISDKNNNALNKKDFDKSKINILFVGRFDRQKGIDILINAIKNKTLKNIHLYLIGDSVLSKGDTQFNSPENVTKIGWVNKEEIDNYYQSIDAVIIPSRWEGFGLVAIEAMKNKKAVIASNRGALPELIKDGFNGYIFDINKISTLYLILESLDKKNLKTLGENGYEHYIQNFTYENMNNEILNVYSSILGKKLEMLNV